MEMGGADDGGGGVARGRGLLGGINVPF
jgi:hypothetical protein